MLCSWMLQPALNSYLFLYLQFRDNKARKTTATKTHENSNRVCVDGLSNGSNSKESTIYAGDTGDEGSLSGSGRSPGGDNGNPFQYSCLNNPLDQGVWRATVLRVVKSQTWLRACVKEGDTFSFLSPFLSPPGFIVSHGSLIWIKLKCDTFTLNRLSPNYKVKHCRHLILYWHVVFSQGSSSH